MFARKRWAHHSSRSIGTKSEKQSLGEFSEIASYLNAHKIWTFSCSVEAAFLHNRSFCAPETLWNGMRVSTFLFVNYNLNLCILKTEEAFKIENKSAK